jgi:predicted extracellular nuclease
MKKLVATLGVLCALVGAANADSGGIQITEWQYNGSEFMEFTNRGATPVDFTGWSYSDSARVPGAVSLSSFGTVASGESVVVAEALDAAFRSTWNLPTSVKVLGGNPVNLGRSDEVNIYDATNTLIDRLTYNDQAGFGPRTDVKSCSIPVAGLELTTASGAWVVASVGDAFGSWAAGSFVANPGQYIVPEPGSMVALAYGLIALVGICRRKCA